MLAWHYAPAVLVDRMERGLCRVEDLTREDRVAAIALVRAHADKTYSLVDALSFVVIERLGGDIRPWGR
jgi:predicted nucleic acid-binding protein